MRSSICQLKPTLAPLSAATSLTVCEYACWPHNCHFCSTRPREMSFCLCDLLPKSCSPNCLHLHIFLIHLPLSSLCFLIFIYRTFLSHSTQSTSCPPIQLTNCWSLDILLFKPFWLFGHQLGVVLNCDGECLTQPLSTYLF